MAGPYHLYRLSDCMERMGRSSGPVLVIPCNQHCRPSADPCVYGSQFQPLLDLPLSIILVHQQDLPQILTLLCGASWGHALLFCHGRMVRHWPQIPTRAELDAALATIVPA